MSTCICVNLIKYILIPGAEVIFDFDDDNMLKFWMKDASPDPVMDIDNFGPEGGLGQH